MKKTKIKEYWSKDFLEGEKSMARAVLRRIEAGRDINHIKLLCWTVCREIPNSLLQTHYKNGYNQCLKDQKLTGKKYQNLYL